MLDVRRLCPGLLILLVGCAGPYEDGTSPVELERTQIGDTTIVRTIGQGVWRDTATLVEEVSIGVLEGAEEYQFGSITDLAVDDSGGVYVFDSQAPALRYYDSAGSYVRTVGGEGPGPGEYLDTSLGLAVRHSDGRLLMRDPRNMRLNVYNPDGTYSDSWRIQSGLYTFNATVVDTADHMYLKILTDNPEPNMPLPVALLHLNAEGEIVDTLEPPILANEPTEPGGSFIRSKAWAYSPLGGFVAGVTDSYEINHYRPDGTVMRIAREATPVRLHPEEKAEYQAGRDWIIERQGQLMTSEPPPIPDVKPIFRSLLIGDDGSIWVLRYAEAMKDESIEIPAEPDPNAPPVITWREPVMYDVFDPDGVFLGPVVVPPRTNLSIIRGTQVWGIRRGEFDEPTVVRFHLDIKNQD